MTQPGPTSRRDLGGGVGQGRPINSQSEATNKTSKKKERGSPRETVGARKKFAKKRGRRKNMLTESRRAEKPSGLGRFVGKAPLLRREISPRNSRAQIKFRPRGKCNFKSARKGQPRIVGGEIFDEKFNLQHQRPVLDAWGGDACSVPRGLKFRGTKEDLWRQECTKLHGGDQGRWVFLRGPRKHVRTTSTV